MQCIVLIAQLQLIKSRTSAEQQGLAEGDRILGIVGQRYRVLPVTGCCLQVLVV